ncbi:DNA-binding response regulator VicR [Paenibacillus alvei TS-15]|jgi:two-component system, OmpR family, response regulator|uniref:DNA-binding response regulator VicR n=1 Tax=Paenibacillus alvei TS-15 TaxID=1117108 RepID=S9SSV6_PAEAL|nr:response regulator transcription factor [Paenibacillus alvei]EPY07228.1 DNA-binding response regulator VicR [Paenibacillus alvei TS-15]
MKKVLIIEDEELLRESMVLYFKDDGYVVYTAEDGQQGLEQFAAYDIDLVILDVMLPELDGWDVCRRIRDVSKVPIILVTASSDEEEALLGFDLGADDYVTKPFKPAVLMARARRLLKSASQNEQQDDIILCGIHVNKSAHKVSIEGTAINLTQTEYTILLSLMEHKEQVITRDTLITTIWGYEQGGDDKALNTHIRNLRYKLGDKAKHITTVVRVGYKFEVLK